jgi:tetratricopeptide (TPR) repeat protein
MAAACVSAPPAPAIRSGRVPAYPQPTVPEALQASPAVGAFEGAWGRFVSGDVAGASRDFDAILKGTPTFYPAETALGYVALFEQQPKLAVSRFAGVTGRDERYLPAWLGTVEGQLALGDSDAAIAALERILEIDPTRETERTRLELLRLKQVQTLLEAGREARREGRTAEADRVLTRALAIAPGSGPVLRELAWTRIAAGRPAQAETLARQAVAADAGDAQALAALGEALDALGRTDEAQSAYARAAAIDSRWKVQADALRDKAAMAALPEEMRGLPTTQAVTRAQVAAVIASRLHGVLQRAASRPPVIATDVRESWAASAILEVTQAGVMDLFANHTFQPGARMVRADLAEVMARLTDLVLAAKPAELARLRAIQPRFADLPASHLSYRAAALAVAAGTMSARTAGGRGETPTGDSFRPTDAASGGELLAAVGRLEQLMMR